MFNEPKRRLGPAIEQKLLEEKQNVLLELQQQQEQQQQVQDGKQTAPAHTQQQRQHQEQEEIQVPRTARPVPKVSLYSVARRLLQGDKLATLHRKPLQGFLDLLDRLSIEVMELTPAQAVARALELTGLAAAVKENLRKKREKEAAAGASAEDGGGGGAAAGRGPQPTATVSSSSTGGDGASRVQQQQQSARTAVGSDDESEESSEEISDSDEEDVEDEEVAPERASVSEVGKEEGHCRLGLFDVPQHHLWPLLL